MAEKKQKYNTQNLKPFNQLTESERREIARKGGIESGKSRALRKTLREALEGKLDEKSGTKGKTMQDKIIDAIVRRAASGDTRAFEIIRDTIGQKPTDKVDISATDGINVNIRVVDSND